MVLERPRCGRTQAASRRSHCAHERDGACRALTDGTGDHDDLGSDRGNWLHFKGRLRHNWAKLTDEDVTRINGRRDELAARLQERYGFARSEAEREIGAWIRCQRHAAA